MLNHLEQLRHDIAGLTGRGVARMTGDLAQSGPWRLTLELRADPDGRLSENAGWSTDEPVGPYCGAVVRLHHQHRIMSTESCWGIEEDLDAGCSADHPFWEHLAQIARWLAAECLDEPRIRQTLQGKVQTLQSILAEI